MVIRIDIGKNNQLTVLPCFTFIPKTGVSFIVSFIVPFAGNRAQVFLPNYI